MTPRMEILVIALGTLTAASTTATAVAAFQTWRETKRNGRYLIGEEDAGRPGLIERMRRVEKTLRENDIRPEPGEDVHE